MQIASLATCPMSQPMRGEPMKQDVIRLLDRYRVMTIASLRSDGWPQATMVGYANEGLWLYFIVSRRSQKLANISHDNRVSIAIGQDTRDPWAIEGLSMSARAWELRDAAKQDRAYRLLRDRHPEFAALPKMDRATAAVMEAHPEHITILNYSKGFGHADVITVGADGLVTMGPARADDWGWVPAK